MDFSNVSQGAGLHPPRARPDMRLALSRVRLFSAFIVALGLFFFSTGAWAQALEGPGELRIEDLPDARPGPTQPVVPLDTIVLDAGHGGLDEGVMGPSGLLEKDVTLRLAQHLSTLLRARLGARVIQTRTEDISLTVSERTSLANNAKAQLFISIHLEGSSLRDTEGFRLYTSSPAPSGEAAIRGVGPEGTNGLDTILWDLAQTGFSNESARLAELMADGLHLGVGLRRAGITKAPLFILSGAQMPAIVVSPAHLTNAREELLLQDETFLQKVAENLYEAILNFAEGRDVAE